MVEPVRVSRKVRVRGHVMRWGGGSRAGTGVWSCDVMGYCVT